MKAVVKVVDPAKVEVEVTLRMDLGALRKLASQLREPGTFMSYPACDLLPVISRVLRAAETVIHLEPVVNPDPRTPETEGEG